MTYIELPRALEDYFAFAEIDPTRNGRRFTISLPYFDGQRLDRLRWWYHLSREQEERLGDTLIATLRAQAIQRFRKHIERWLQNTGQRLYAEEHEPIPCIGRLGAAKPAVTTQAPVVEPAPPAETDASVPPWRADRVANG